MKDEIETLYELQKRNLIYSPWAKEQSLLRRVEELKGEVEEALEEVKNEEWDKFKDEIGDVLWDCLGAIARAEFEKKLTMKEVLDHIHSKFTARKPFLVEERHVTLDEEMSIWNDVKTKQKNRQNKRTMRA
jgi:tetrapyrrole methylase family protein / MazG family protein